MKQRSFFLYLGIIGPILFWLTTIVCGLMIEDYNHMSNLVSELGALNSKPQHIFTAGLVLCSVLNILFVVGIYKVCRNINISVIPIIMLLFFSFLAGPAIVPMPLRLHGIVGIPFPFMMLSPLFAMIYWRKYEKEIKIRTGAIIGLIIMLLGFLIFLPDILAEYFGLKQRFLYLGWTIWSIYLAFRFIQISMNPILAKN
jgi:hypothetical membrane protein